MSFKLSGLLCLIAIQVTVCTHSLVGVAWWYLLKKKIGKMKNHGKENRRCARGCSAVSFRPDQSRTTAQQTINLAKLLNNVSAKQKKGSVVGSQYHQLELRVLSFHL